MELGILASFCQTQKRSTPMKKKLFLLVALTFVVLAMSACIAVPMAVPAAAPVSVNQDTTVNVIVDQSSGCTTCGKAPAPAVPAVVEPTVQPTAYVPIYWDTTCIAQSALVGVKLTPFKEGPAIACIWSGTATNINVPSGTYADVDKGTVYLAVGPTFVPAVGRLTLRLWDTGSTNEICSHLTALMADGAKQNPQYFPVLLDNSITCPAQ
jgi:hypothetical protein